MESLANRKKVGLVAGPILFFLFLLSPSPAEMNASSQSVAAVAVLMALWWITEAVPIPITALLPVVLFPALGVMPSSEVTRNYANHLIYLYLGGFFIAVTIERWGLHRRIALLTIRAVGCTPGRITLGFMLATWALSMWISNTATTMMMLPIGTAVIIQATQMLEDGQSEIDTRPGHFAFATALMLGIAYAASIGGIATIIGTPPNAILLGVIEKTYGVSISFVSWMMLALPLSVVMLVLTWIYLTRIACRSRLRELPGGRKLIDEEIKKLGAVSEEERRTLFVFLAVALGWIFRGTLGLPFLAQIHDTTIAVAGGIALFLIPAPSTKGKFLLNWKTAVQIPWDVIILFGGGFALAAGFSESGLTEWIGGRLTILSGFSTLAVIGAACLVVIFLTEITSNTATASLILPLMAALAAAVDLHPYGLMVSVALAASFAFMMPVATPPNAIVFSSPHVTIPLMARIGFWLNLLGWFILVLFMLFWLPEIWGIDLHHYARIGAS